MSDTEGTQSVNRPTPPNRVTHLPGSDRDVQFPSLSRVASRIVKDRPRRSDSGRAISPRAEAQAVLDSVQYSDAAAIRYLKQAQTAAEPWHVSLASAAFCALNWPHCSGKTSDLQESLEDARDNVRSMLGLDLVDTSHHCHNLTRSYWQQTRSESATFPSLWPDASTGLDGLTSELTDGFEKLTGNLLEKLSKINEIDTDRAYRTMASLKKLAHSRELVRRVIATLENAEGSLALALGDYSTYSNLMWLDWRPQEGSGPATATGSQSESKSEWKSKSKVKSESETKVESESESKVQSELVENAEMSGALPPGDDSTSSNPIWPGWKPHEGSFLAIGSESESESESESAGPQEGSSKPPERETVVIRVYKDDPTSTGRGDRQAW